MIKMPELKPCPFCGENVNFSKSEGVWGWHKDNCFFQFLQDKEADMTAEELNREYIKAWNRRAE